MNISILNVFAITAATVGVTEKNAGSKTINFPVVEHFKRIKVESGEGRIHVKKGRSSLNFEKEIFDEQNCDLSAEVREGTLHIVSKKKPNVQSARCVVHMDIVAPTQTHLEISAGASDIYIENMSGSIATKLGTGLIQGKVSPQDFTSELGSGSVDMSFFQQSRQTPIDIKIGAGNCDLKFDESAKLNWDFKGSPYVTSFDPSDFAKNSASPEYVVNVKIGVGKLRFQKNS